MNGDRRAVVAVAVLLALSLFDPLHPKEQFLQHLPTVPALIALFVVSGRQPRLLGSSSVRALLLFIVLHIIGARWVYSFVPYDSVATALFGTSVTETFDFTRNHYDRFVHLAFGALCVLPIAELAVRPGRLTRGWAVAFAVSAVFALSGLYEVFEWALTIALSPEHAATYNGQQGDAWDAQKDMAFAALGAALAIWPTLRARALRRSTDDARERIDASSTPSDAEAQRRVRRSEPVAPASSAFEGMTVNERLFSAGLLDAFDRAARTKDRARMIALLEQVEVPDAAKSVGTILADPSTYGF